MYMGLPRRSLSGWKACHKILENEYFGRRIRTGRLIRLIRLIQERFRVNAAGAEAIEDVEEETLSVSFAEDAGRKSSRRDQKQHCGIHKKVI